MYKVSLPWIYTSGVLYYIFTMSRLCKWFKKFCSSYWLQLCKKSFMDWFHKCL